MMMKYNNLSGTAYPVEWGYDEDDRLGSTAIPVEYGDNLGDITDSLQSTEMQLLKISKVNDFGEKIGGSAKDKRFKSGSTTTPTKEPKFKDYLPDLDTTAGEIYINLLRSQGYRPTLNYFQKTLNLNKLLARIAFLQWYCCDQWTFFITIRELVRNKEMQSDVMESILGDGAKFYEYYELGEGGFWAEIDYNIFDLTRFGMSLEKTLGEDNFDWNIVRKIRYDKTILTKTSYSKEAKQWFFNYEYGVIENGDIELCLLYSTRGPLITSKLKSMSGGWSLTSNDKYVMLDYAGVRKSSEFKERYVELFKEGIKLYEAKFGPTHQEKDTWQYQDKVGLFAKLREGEDYRMGRNAEPKDFIDTFGFRAVEFGESMPQKERWEHMNRTFDAFMDLANILHVDPKFISLNRLGLCFGSRGHGGRNPAAAHFEPVKFVINLTRKNGAGCLAHEWFHALDTSLMNDFDSGCYHLSDVAKSKCHRVYYSATENINIFEAVRLLAKYGDTNPIWTNFLNFSRSVYKENNFHYYDDALRLDKKKGKDYWSTPTEMMARGFEYYIIERLKRNNQLNEYLAQIPERKTTDRAYPYPYDTDKDIIMEDYDAIFEAISLSQFELMESWNS